MKSSLDDDCPGHFQYATFSQLWPPQKTKKRPTPPILVGWALNLVVMGRIELPTCGL